MLAELEEFNRRASPVFSQRPKRSKVIETGDRVVGRVLQKDLRLGKEGAKHIDAVVVSTRRGEVELGWKFGENIVVQPNDVVLWADMEGVEARKAAVLDSSLR